MYNSNINIFIFEILTKNDIRVYSYIINTPYIHRVYRVWIV